MTEYLSQPNSILKIGGIEVDNFSTSTSTLSMTHETPSCTEVQQWLLNNSNSSNTTAESEDINVADKNHDNEKEIYVVNIDDNGFLVPPVPLPPPPRREGAPQLKIVNTSLSTSNFQFVDGKVITYFLYKGKTFTFYACEINIKSKCSLCFLSL